MQKINGIPLNEHLQKVKEENLKRLKEYKQKNYSKEKLYTLFPKNFVDTYYNSN